MFIPCTYICSMPVEKIIADWKKKSFKPFYWLEGEEGYFIDQLMQYAEHHILSEAEAGFNLTVFYGRDADWASVVNACMRYPMFAEHQVVLLKEAQHMKDIEKLEGYLSNPLHSTIFVAGYKEKKLDGRGKMSRLVKQKGVYFLSEKIKDYKLSEWSLHMIEQHGLTIGQKALLLLVDHIGNDLSRIQNEIEKLSVNLKGRKNITEDDIEEFIGISKEFNPFELQVAVGKRDFAGAIRIIQYFASNPKVAPVQLVLPSLYNFFSKVAMVFGANTNDEKAVGAAIGVNPYFVKDYMAAARIYSYAGTEKILLLLHQYNLRSIGVNDSGTEGADLLKELVVKIMS